MTTIYKFKAAFTLNGSAKAPSPAPTCTVVDTSDNLLVNAQPVTTLTNLVGVCLYSYSGADGLDLIGKFVTTDAAVDCMTLYSYTADVITTNVNATISSRSSHSVADIWNALTSGLTTISSIGKLLVDNITASILAVKTKTDNLPTDPADQSAVEAAITAATSPLATSANLATVDTVVDAIKLKTDLIPTDPADQSLVEAAITAATSPLATSVNLAIVDTVVDAIKLKTDLIPTDPADQSAVEAAITAATSPLASALSLGAVDANVSAIKAKTDALPLDPADQSAIEAAIIAATAALATSVDLAVVDTVVDAIKLKTDLIPSDPADQSAVEAAITAAAAAIRGADNDTLKTLSDQIDTIDTNGAGSVLTTITVNDGINPIDGVDVWISTDSAGTNVVARGSTGALGTVAFWLDAGTYYAWKQLAGYDFTNPQSFTVS